MTSILQRMVDRAGLTLLGQFNSLARRTTPEHPASPLRVPLDLANLSTPSLIGWEAVS